MGCNQASVLFRVSFVLPSCIWSHNFFNERRCWFKLNWGSFLRYRFFVTTMKHIFFWNLRSLDFVWAFNQGYWSNRHDNFSTFLSLLCPFFYNFFLLTSFGFEAWTYFVTRKHSSRMHTDHFSDSGCLPTETLLTETPLDRDP